MAYNNLQILNFNHNIVSLSNGNTLVITDNIKGNSINIPEPITHILQINSPGPQGIIGPSGSQGPAGPSGSQGPIGPQGPVANTGSFATTGSNTFIGNQIITGSITFDGGAQIVPNTNVTGAIDIIAGSGGGAYASLTSNNTQSFVWVDNDGAYALTANQYQFEFRNDGYFVIPQVQSLTKQAGILSAGDIIIQADEMQSWRFVSGSGILQAPGGIEAPSFTGSLQGTASYATTASYALNAGAGAGFPFSGSAIITGSLLVSGSGITITGSLEAVSINNPTINLYNFQNFS